jgi:hypothetical protein
MDLHQFDLLLIFVVVSLLVPPLLGGIIGWAIGRVLLRPRGAVTHGILGGLTGGWVAVLLYRKEYLPGSSGHFSLLLFSAYVVLGVLVGAPVLVLARKYPKN